MAQNPEFRFQILRTAQVDGQRINIWRSAPFEEVLPLILSKSDAAVFVPVFDADEFTLPDPNLFRTTDCYSDGEIRGFRWINNKNRAMVSEEAEYILYKGRVQRDAVMSGVALPRDARFMLLQTFFDEKEYDVVVKQYNEAIEKAKKEAKKNLTTRDSNDQSGRTLLS